MCFADPFPSLFILNRTNPKLVPPSIAHFNFGDKPSNFGDSASVQCLVTSGDLPIDFKWYFNGRPVKEYSGITTVKLGNRNSVLNIDSVTANHAGAFTCQASNVAASLNFTSELVVKGTQYSNLTKSKTSNDNFIKCFLFLFIDTFFFCYHTLFLSPVAIHFQRYTSTSAELINHLFCFITTTY